MYKEKKPQLPPNAPILVELFSGGGGVATAAVLSGIRPVLSVEHDPSKPELSKALLEQHQNNFFEYGGVALQQTVQTVDWRIQKEMFREIDFLHASPVCSNFSKANVGGEESETDIECAIAVTEAIKILRPKIFTLEQVTDYNKSRSLALIKQCLDDLGYSCETNIVNFRTLGLPQNRIRLILRAVQPNKSLPIIPPLPEKEILTEWFDSINDLIPSMEDADLIQVQKDKVDITKLSAPIYSSRVGHSAGRVVKKGEAIGTITRTMFTDGKGANRNKCANIIFPDGRIKNCSIRAMARLQGFPDWYVFDENAAVAGSSIGYSCPPIPFSKIFQGLIPLLISKQLTSYDVCDNVEKITQIEKTEENNMFGAQVKQLEVKLNAMREMNNESGELSIMLRSLLAKAEKHELVTEFQQAVLKEIGYSSHTTAISDDDVLEISTGKVATEIAASSKNTINSLITHEADKAGIKAEPTEEDAPAGAELTEVEDTSTSAATEPEPTETPKAEETPVTKPAEVSTELTVRQLMELRKEVKDNLSLTPKTRNESVKTALLDAMADNNYNGQFQEEIQSVEGFERDWWLMAKAITEEIAANITVGEVGSVEEVGVVDEVNITEMVEQQFPETTKRIKEDTENNKAVEVEQVPVEKSLQQQILEDAAKQVEEDQKAAENGEYLPMIAAEEFLKEITQSSKKWDELTFFDIQKASNGGHPRFWREFQLAARTEAQQNRVITLKDGRLAELLATYLKENEQLTIDSFDWLPARIREQAVALETVKEVEATEDWGTVEVEVKETELPPVAESKEDVLKAQLATMQGLLND